MGDALADGEVRSYPFGPIAGLEIDPMYFWLQEHEPLSRVKLPYGEMGWLVVRYDDCRMALADPRFSLAQAVVRDVPRLHPDQLALLRSRPELMPNAIDELMRWVPLLMTADTLPRYTLSDVGLSGGTVPAGEPVLVAKHAANRDWRAYADPDRLDLTRDAQGQIGFGYGAHHCLGAQLARMDLQVALASLFDRFPGLHLAVPGDQLQWKSGMAVRGPVSLPVGW